jgi:hypothetical protein
VLTTAQYVVSTDCTAEVKQVLAHCCIVWNESAGEALTASLLRTHTDKILGDITGVG